MSTFCAWRDEIVLSPGLARSGVCRCAVLNEILGFPSSVGQPHMVMALGEEIDKR